MLGLYGKVLVAVGATGVASVMRDKELSHLWLDSATFSQLQNGPTAGQS